MMAVIIDMTKAKEIGHEIRRDLRSKEFEPLDNVIMKQIPDTDFNAVESERQLVREKYDAIQIKIDKAKDANTILDALNLPY